MMAAMKTVRVALLAAAALVAVAAPAGAATPVLANQKLPVVLLGGADPGREPAWPRSSVCPAAT